MEHTAMVRALMKIRADTMAFFISRKDLVTLMHESF